MIRKHKNRTPHHSYSLSYVQARFIRIRQYYIPDLDLSTYGPAFADKRLSQNDEINPTQRFAQQRPQKYQGYDNQNHNSQSYNGGRHNHGLRKLTQVLSVFLIVASLVSTAIWFGPDVYFRLFPAQTIALTPQEEGTPLGGTYAEGRSAKKLINLPPQDPNLPDGEWLIIPKIGVRTEIDEGTDGAQAMLKGVWQVPDYGKPGDLTKPLILTAHRFGYTWWLQGDYWKYHSFYLLPDLQPGDLVEVIADKRKYTYEVYKAEEGENISDYQADGILYTCKFLNSSVRYFRYVRLLDAEKNTQASNE